MKPLEEIEVTLTVTRLQSGQCVVTMSGHSKVDHLVNHFPMIASKSLAEAMDASLNTMTQWLGDRAKEQEAEERKSRRIGFSHLEQAFGTKLRMTRKELVAELTKLGFTEASSYRGVGMDGHARRFLLEEDGWLSLRKEGGAN